MGRPFGRSIAFFLHKEITMDDLIKMVTERVGIPQDKARSAVELIVSQLKSRLPGPLGSQIDGALSGSGGGIGGMMGGKQSQTGIGSRDTTRS
jgi:hypothetical protein